MDPSNAVVHLTMRHGDYQLAIGSGVLYRKNEKVFIITAWHNVTGLHSTTLKPLSNSISNPNNLVAYISCRGTNDSYSGYCRLSFTIPLESSNKALYFIHPQAWPRIDIVAIQIDPQYPYDSEGYLSDGKKVVTKRSMQQETYGKSLNMGIECIQDFEKNIADLNIDFSQTLAVSDDLFIIGYPKGITDMFGQPLWKRATVASSPHLGWQQQKQFLVDCASREGMSGAPVIYHNKTGNLQFGSTSYHNMGPVTIFHGIYASRMGHVSQFEAQIGTVWQRKLIDEIIENEIYAPLSDEIKISLSKVRDAIHSLWPESEDYPKIVLGKGVVINYLLTEVMKKIQGRSNPEDVLEEIKKIAKSKTN